MGNILSIIKDIQRRRTGQKPELDPIMKQGIREAEIAKAQAHTKYQRTQTAKKISMAKRQHRPNEIIIRDKKGKAYRIKFGKIKTIPEELIERWRKEIGGGDTKPFRNSPIKIGLYHKGNVVGAIVGHPIEHCPGYIEVPGIIVTPEFAGAGLGKQLFKQMILEAQQKQMKGLHFDQIYDNALHTLRSAVGELKKENINCTLNFKGEEGADWMGQLDFVN